MRIFVTPRSGLQVRDPHNPAAGYLPAEGTAKDDSQAWRRLERDGDVTITADAATETQTRRGKSAPQD